MKDMFGNDVTIGDMVRFHDTGNYRRYGCDTMFLLGEWEVRNIEGTSIRVVDGHLPGDLYYFWFPLNATEVVNKDTDEIDSTCDISELF